MTREERNKKIDKFLADLKDAPKKKQPDGLAKLLGLTSMRPWYIKSDGKTAVELVNFVRYGTYNPTF